MTPSKLNEKELNQADRKKIMSALFQDFVIQHGQTALVMLGRMPGTDGQLMTDPDPEAAKTLIDQLEMLRDKTRGNLIPRTRLVGQKYCRTPERFRQNNGIHGGGRISGAYQGLMRMSRNADCMLKCWFQI